ncbi:MAG: hypothetical protein GQ476_07295 [Candidatus Aminicenantes bacterium]|nr:hypothetical protein [Candidatus Aminicenantes bacterium]
MERVESLRTENKFKKTEIGEIPVDWEVVKAQDVCEKAECGYTESATEKLVGPKFLRISDIQNGNVNWESIPFCHCPNLIREKYLLKPGDILFARTGATTGKSYIIKRCPETVFASCLIRIVTKGRINSYFLYLVFNSFIYWKQIKEQIGGSAQGGVNASLLSSIKVPLPPLPEQEKIAEVLLSVDEAIDKKQEIVKKIKMLKKGLMRELLTHGIGHTKFKKTGIGKIPVDWEALNLNNISSSTTIKTIKAPELKRLKFAIPPLPEQKKIAEILISVDEEIEKEIAQKEKIEKIKKGLMQVLLTGKIRVKI